MRIVVSESFLQMNGISTTELYESECSILAKSIDFKEPLARTTKSI